VDSKDHPILLTESPLNSEANRGKMTQIMFETFNVPAMYAAIPQLLSLYSTGRTTGLVLDIGDEVTTVVPIFEGYALRHAVTRLEFGGHHLTDFLGKLLVDRGFSFGESEKHIRGLKETVSYVSSSFAQDLANTNPQWMNRLDKTYTFSDGQSIVVGKERFQCGEILFNPKSVGIESPGIHEAAYQSIMKCDADIRKKLFKNIVLSGGTGQLPGLVERLQQELGLVWNSDVKVIRRDGSVWIGGSILASLPTFQTTWVTRADFDEMGPSVVNKKCF